MDWFLIAARALHFAAAISLAGIFGFERLIARPAIARTRADAGRLRRRLSWLAAVSLLLALVSGAAWLAGVAAEMSGKPLSLAVREGVVTVVLTQTRFGEDWVLRLALAVLLAICLAGRQALPRRAAEAAGWAAFAVAAAMLASLAWAGHGAATVGAPGDLHLAADILHLLGAGLWLGTLPPLALLLAAARRTGDADLAAVARLATRRYTLLAVASVSALLAGGLVNTWFLAGTIPALVGTEYGRLLLGKIALFIVMLLLAAVNLLRLTPRLANPVGTVLWRTLARLQRNAVDEAAIGLAILGVVGALGILPPGLHTEPGWPFSFRANLALLSAGSRLLLAILAALICVCAIAAAAAAAAARYRLALVSGVGLAFSFAAGALALRPAIEPAYPTSFYAPSEPYAAPSVARGAPLYGTNCALCHGAEGRGDGPAAASLPVRPANLTETHLFAHSPGDLYWWVSHGRNDGVMPGFASVLKPRERWDVINFILARAAGVLSHDIGPEVTAAAAPEVPDFAFETGGRQETLGETLKSGPVLLVLLRPPAPAARLSHLAAAKLALAAAGLQVVALRLRAPAKPRAPPLPLLAGTSREVASTLSLFDAAKDGAETELLLDRGGRIRARWTKSSRAGLASPRSLVAAAKLAARFAVAAPSHAGHGG